MVAPAAGARVVAFDALACPLDGASLHAVDGGWRCPSGHHFDSASQGYIHLLPVQHKRSRDPGDSRAMVDARRRFLASDAYQPIAAAMCAAALADSAPDATLACLDAGVGEGYYLREFAAHAPATQTLSLLGLDISKPAILTAAKLDKRPRWVVGSNARLPVQDAMLDRVLCLFGFPVYPEFARVLKPGGVLVQVDAGTAHLRELREIIYPVVKPERPHAPFTPAGFAPRADETLTYPLTLTDPAQIADLLAMTPHLHRASAEGRERAARLTTLALTIDVRLTRWERMVA